MCDKLITLKENQSGSARATEVRANAGLSQFKRQDQDTAQSLLSYRAHILLVQSVLDHHPSFTLRLHVLARQNLLLISILYQEDCVPCVHTT